MVLVFSGLSLEVITVIVSLKFDISHVYDQNLPKAIVQDRVFVCETIAVALCFGGDRGHDLTSRFEVKACWAAVDTTNVSFRGVVVLTRLGKCKHSDCTIIAQSMQRV
ncbi:hypothetical protein IRJ41_020808 [Triplophysa rosa]|uniref:Secreted protein n=1 Tax=Triplophysa rosa TaxID=992332 RepID=A0A9W7WP66_TRIRA|nr:hypothetical protein IRJ41_020808 [Triplophysa rosa]